MNGLEGRMVLWLLVLFVPLLLYFQLRSDAKFKKNIVVGVTLPMTARSHEGVLALLQKFKRQQRWLTAGLIALGGVCLLLPISMGGMLTLFFIWVDLCVVLPYLPYVRCNRDLRRLKQEQGWSGARELTARTVDLKAAAQPLQEMSMIHLILPLILSLIPVVYEFALGERSTAPILLINVACLLLCYALYRWCYRRRAEMVDSDTRLTETLTRVRRQYWLKANLWLMWYMGLMSLLLWVALYRPLLGGGLLALVTVAMVVMVVSLEFKLRRVQEQLTRESGQGFYVDEDDKWLWGIFYYDPHDVRLIVNSRVGMNTTVNLARRAGQILMGACAVLLIAMPLFGVWAMQEEKTPVEMSVTDGVLEAEHGNSRYEIPLEEIAEARLLEQLPEGLTRVSGTGMDSVLKGKFRAESYGALTLCLDPREGPWLLVKTQNGGQYLLGASQGIEEVARAVISAAAP